METLMTTTNKIEFMTKVAGQDVKDVKFAPLSSVIIKRVVTKGDITLTSTFRGFTIDASSAIVNDADETEIVYEVMIIGVKIGELPILIPKLEKALIKAVFGSRTNSVIVPQSQLSYD